MKGLRFTVYRHPWQRLGRETTQGTWLEPPAKRVVRIVVRYLLRQGDCTFPRQEPIRFRRHRIFFANLHTCSRPATFRKFTSQQLRKIFRSRHGFKLDRHDNIRVIIFRRVYPCIYRPCFHPVCRDRDQDLYSCFTGPTIVMLFQKNCGHRVLI